MVTKETAFKAIKKAHPCISDSYIMNFLNKKRYETLWEKNNWEDEDMVCDFEEWFDYYNGRGSIGSW